MFKFVRSEQRIYYKDKSWECRSDFFPGFNDAGQARETLPDGLYTTYAEEPPCDNGPAYGTFYIETGDYRERDIHGGGSSLPQPYAPRQGFLPTFGCLRMQNEDGEELSRMIIEDGNNVQLEVTE